MPITIDSHAANLLIEISPCAIFWWLTSRIHSLEDCHSINMAFIRTSLSKTFHTIRFYLNPSDAVTVYQLGSAFEILSGLRPFKLAFPFGRKRPPKVSFSWIGFAFSFIHLHVFGVSCAVVLFADMEPLTIFTNNPLASIQTTCMDWLHVLNTLIIFVCSYVRYDRDKKVVGKIQQLEANLQALRVTSVQFQRNSVRIILASLLIDVMQFTLSFYHGLYFYKRIGVLSEKYALSFNVALAMPAVYIQIVLGQFILTVVYIRARMITLNTVLLNVLSSEANVPVQNESKKAQIDFLN